MLASALETAGSALRAFLYIAALVFLIGALSHLVTWALTRKGGLGWVWSYWYLLGATLLVSGLAAIGYGWLVFGFQTGFGSALAALGVLLASAGLWMIIPV